MRQKIFIGLIAAALTLFCYQAFSKEQRLDAKPDLDSATRIFLTSSLAKKKPISAKTEASNFQSAEEAELWPTLVIYRSPFLGSSQVDLSRKNRQENILSSINRPKKFLWIVNGSFVMLSRAELRKLAQDSRIGGLYHGNRKVKIDPTHPSLVAASANLTYGLEKIGLREIHQQLPHLLGHTVRIGIIDSGLDANHPELQGKLKIFKDFTDKQSVQPTDDLGHGTHITGTIAGGQTAPTSGDRIPSAIGIAPGAELVVAKIFTRSQDTTLETTLSAMQWMADPDGNPSTMDQPQVINSSWGSEGPAGGLDPSSEPFCRAVETWTKLGITSVFAAGNRGSQANAIDLPAACPQAIAVGATDMNDQVPSFSSRGPVKWKDLLLEKPEIGAPGWKVLSSKSGGGYEEMSGTSMAAPHVTGLIALMLQKNPTLTPAQVKQMLITSAYDLYQPGFDSDSGFGRLDGLKALTSF